MHDLTARLSGYTLPVRLDEFPCERCGFFDYRFRGTEMRCNHCSATYGSEKYPLVINKDEHARLTADVGKTRLLGKFLIFIGLLWTTYCLIF